MNFYMDVFSMPLSELDVEEIDELNDVIRQLQNIFSDGRINTLDRKQSMGNIPIKVAYPFNIVALYLNFSVMNREKLLIQE